MSSRRLLLLLSISLLLGIVVPIIPRAGIFMDGAIYGTVAHHLHSGDTGFWTPMYTPHFHPSSQSTLPLHSACKPQHIPCSEIASWPTRSTHS